MHVLIALEIPIFTEAAFGVIMIETHTYCPITRELLLTGRDHGQISLGHLIFRSCQ